MNDNHIRKVRQEKNMTQKQLADASKINVRRIAALEHGEVLFQNTTVRNAMKIAAALGCTVEELAKEKNILMNDILSIATKEERDLVQAHCNIYSSISLDQIEEAWRNDDGVLCVKFKGNDWFHYDGKHGWW